ncbi:DUF3515 family protein [Naumannella cuiyingiana]|uniref:DUF3515 domain-containing protein n=1 Tax=Naumannella cuiyingiana TaxID=1347891 RepID=A0A7Z0IMD6_9ACTN|nr:DUF3515 family protein [Naumannella cuiyingiana]NYI72487.1 hypothetical protein [Naumannella cuiyingiana]
MNPHGRHRTGGGALPTVLSALAALPILAGCAGPVDIAEPQPKAAAAQACAKMIADLPPTVGGQDRREARPGRTGAAWGNPAIVLTCGGELPAGAGPDAQCFEVNQVGWYAEESEQGWTFTTLGRLTPVQVTVPPEYAPEANVLVDLARPITDHVPQERPCV